MNCYFLFFYLIALFGLITTEVRASSISTAIPVTTQQPSEGKLYPIAIIGSGAAGTMAVRRAVLNNKEVLLFSGAKQERRRSRGNWVRTVDNVPGLEKYKRTLIELRNETLKDLAEGPLRSNLFVVEDSIISIERGLNSFKLIDGSGHTYHVQYIVLATGMMDEQPHIQGSIRPILSYANRETIAYCLSCDGHRSFGKKTIMIGHSQDAANGALLLSDKYHLASMTILTNGNQPQFSEEILKEMKNKNIVILKSPISEILKSGPDKTLTGFKLESGEIVDAEIGFVSLGIRPNNQLALQLGARLDERGLVITDANGESSIPNVFVAGDLRANSAKQIYTAWQHAVDSIQTIDKRIREAGR